ncbi:MAG: helix-turn-helix domain-containing protein [Verrucomicrobia bacterium]|nr:helix-turn-helix domain-containing protein [Verrucomicrobiota bacterium]
MKNKHQPLYIGIGFDSYRPWNRRVLHGVIRYTREHTNWHLVLPGLATKEMSFFKQLARKADGWIVDRPYVSLPADIPQVAITPESNDRFRTAVISDMFAIGAMAASALYESGYRRAACLNIALGAHYPDDERHAGFLRKAAELGMEVHSLPSPLTELHEADYGAWIHQLRTLIKPLGLFAHNLNEAHALAFLIAESRLGIPNEVGLIVGGDDRTALEALIPSVSGIDRNMEQIGWQAALQLDRLFRNEVVESIVRVPPLGAVLRESTELDRNENITIQKAVQFIRARIDTSLTVEQIAQAAHVSASSLHRRFKECLGHTPAEEIRRQRLRRALKLLRETNLPLSEVSSKCGYAESSQLSRAVKLETRMTPKHFRQATR